MGGEDGTELVWVIGSVSVSMSRFFVHANGISKLSASIVTDVSRKNKVLAFLT